MQSYRVLDALLMPHNKGRASLGLVHIDKTQVVVGLVTPVTFSFTRERHGGLYAARRLRVHGHHATLFKPPGADAVWGSHEPRLSVGRYAHKVALATALRRVKNKPRGVEQFLSSPSGMMLK